MNSLPINVDSGEFSWSFSRRSIYERCPRAYFYRYYGAQKGWDKFEQPEKKHLYVLKNLKKTEAWLSNILSEAAQKVFMSNHTGLSDTLLGKSLYMETIRNYNKNCEELRNGEWRDDPKKLNLFELYYNNEDSFDFPFSKQSKLKQRLLNALNNFVQSSLFYELEDVQSLSWKILKRPVSFFFNGVTVWTSPHLAWASNGKFKILNFQLNQPESEGSQNLLNGLNSLLVQQKFMAKPENIQCLTFYYETDGGLLRKSENIDTTEAERLISESSMEMLAKISIENKVFEADFPKCCADFADCNNLCEFQEHCVEANY